jgi:menaquinone-dependent protoporphyrinogen oxidase
MSILVAYATRHGATQGIAERIAARLQRTGLEVTLTHVDQVGAVEEYEAFVVGGAAYRGHWMSEATTFVRQHLDVLARHPVWLFSSGPVGTETVDANGRDVMEASEPEEFGGFAEAIHPRDLRVFFGAFDPDARPIGLIERLAAPFMRMPAVREALPAGDFRDWPAIETWADGIAGELKPSGQAEAIAVSP